MRGRAQEAAELRETAAVLATAARLRAAVEARIAVTRQLPPLLAPITAARRRRPRGRVARRGWAAAAALVAVAAGLTLHTLAQQDRVDTANTPLPALAIPAPRATGAPIVERGLGETRTIALSIEPAHGSAQPSSTPILLLGLAS